MPGLLDYDKNGNPIKRMPSTQQEHLNLSGFTPVSAQVQQGQKTSKPPKSEPLDLSGFAPVSPSRPSSLADKSKPGPLGGRQVPASPTPKPPNPAAPKPMDSLLRQQIDDLKKKYLQPDDGSIVRQTASALIANPNDQQAMARFQHFHPVTQQAIMEVVSDERGIAAKNTQLRARMAAKGVKTEPGNAPEQSFGRAGMNRIFGNKKMEENEKLAGPGHPFIQQLGANIAKLPEVLTEPRSVATMAGATAAAAAAPAVAPLIGLGFAAQGANQAGQDLASGNPGSAAVNLGGAVAAAGIGEAVKGARGAGEELTIGGKHATGEVKIEKGGQPEHPGVPQGRNVPKDAGQVRQGKSGSPGNRGGAQPAAKGEGEGVEGQAKGQVTPRDVTSARKAMMASDREALNLPELPAPERKAWQTTLSNAKSKGLGDQSKALSLSNEIAAKPRPLNDEETAGIVLRSQEIKNQHNELVRQVGAEIDPAKIDAHRQAMKLLEDEFDLHSASLKKSGTEKGRALASQKLTLNQDYDLISVKARAKAEKGEDLSPKRANEYESLVAQHEELKARVAELEKSKVEVDAQSALDQQIKAAKRTETKVQRSARKAALKDEFGSLVDQWKKIGQSDPETGEQKMLSGFSDEHFQVAAKMVKNLVEQGVENLHEIVSTMHDALGDTIDRIDVHHLIAGYGREPKAVSPENAAVNAKLQEMKSLARRISKFQDVLKGQTPLKGKAPRPPSEEVKQLQADLDSYMKSAGIETRAKPKRGVSLGRTDQQRLDAAITRKTNDIATLKAKLQAGITETAKLEAVSSPELEKLKTEYAGLKAKRDSLKPPGAKRSMSDAQKLGMRKAGVRARIADLARRLQEGDTSKKPPSSIQPDAELQSLQGQEKALRGYYNTTKPPTESIALTDAQRLKAVKTRLTKDIADLERRVASGDTSPKMKRASVSMDQEAAALKQKKSQLEYKIQQMIASERKPHPMDYINAIQRFSILSGINSAEKIGIASVERVALDTTESMFGTALSKVPGLKGVAERSPGEGAAPIGEDVKAFVKAWSGRDMAAKAWTGKSSVDQAYFNITGKHPEIRTNNAALKLLELPGRIHGAIKLPAQRAAWERGLARRAAYEVRQGNNLEEPATQIRVAEGAYADSLNAIFRGDNLITKAWNSGMVALEQSSKSSNKGAALAGKSLQVAARLELPVVRIPTNLALESTLYSPWGIVRGALEVVASKGVKNLRPEQADLVMRATKKGMIGSAVMAVVWNSPSKIKVSEKEGDIPGLHRGDMSVFGMRVPNNATHHPLLMAIKTTAEMRKAYDTSQERGVMRVAESAAQAVASTAKDIPFTSNLQSLGRAVGSGKAVVSHLKQLGKSFIPIDLKPPYKPAAKKRKLGKTKFDSGLQSSGSGLGSSGSGF